MKKELKLVLLPTNNKSDISLGIRKPNKPLLNYNKGLQYDATNDKNIINQHLYAISDEKLSEDYINNNICLFISSNGIIKCLAGGKLGLVKTIGTYYKIEITTDDLRLSRTNYQNNWIPTFTNDFINTYVERYNKGEIIEYVEVEYENIKQVLSSTPKTTPNGSSYTEVEYEKTEVLKVNPDNTVDVSFNKGLDLNKLEQKLDDILIKETKESSEKMLIKQN